MSSKDTIRKLLTELQDGSGEFDRSLLQNACLEVSDDELPGDVRHILYKWLLLGSVRREVPTSWGQTSASSTEAKIDADIASLLTQIKNEAEAPINDDENGPEEKVETQKEKEKELRGMVAFLCSKTGLLYSSDLVEILGPLLVLPTTPSTTLFSLFYTIKMNFIPSLGHHSSLQQPPAMTATANSSEETHQDATTTTKDQDVDGNKEMSQIATELLRLVLQFHDPELSTHLDQCRADWGWHLLAWCGRLFAPLATTTSAPMRDESKKEHNNVSSSFAMTLHLWDWIFVHNEPLLVIFVALQLLRSEAVKLFAIHDKKEVTKFFDHWTSTPCRRGQSVKEFKNIVFNAKLMLRNTPFCTRSLLWSVFFGVQPSGSNGLPASSLSPPVTSTESSPNPSPSKPLVPLDTLSPQELKEKLLSCVVLPIEAGELINAFKAATEDESTPRPKHLNYVVLDCRAEKSFHFARLPTALHIGNDIGFDPELLNKMLERFENARGSHFCVLGTGRDLSEEVKLLNLITLHFVQAGFPYVGVADGGFKACIPHIKAGAIEFVKTPMTSSPEAKYPLAEGENPSTDAKPAGQTHSLEEVKVKAAQNLTAAKKWGLGIVKNVWSKVQRGGGEHGTNPDQSGREELGIDEAGPGTTQQHSANPVGCTGAKMEGEHSSSGNFNKQQSSGITEGSGAGGGSTNVSQKLFTLHEGDDEDFDELITSVPASGTSILEVDANTHTAEDSPPKKIADVLDATEPAGSPNVELPAPHSATKESEAPSTSSVEKHPFDDIFV